MCWDPNTYEVNSCPYYDCNEKFVIIKWASKKCARRSPSTTWTNRGKCGRLGKGKAKNPHFKRKRKGDSKNEKISSQNDSDCARRSSSTTWTLSIDAGSS